MKITLFYGKFRKQYCEAEMFRIIMLRGRQRIYVSLVKTANNQGSAKTSLTFCNQFLQDIFCQVCQVVCRALANGQGVEGLG